MCPADLLTVGGASKLRTVRQPLKTRGHKPEWPVLWCVRTRKCSVSFGPSAEDLGDVGGDLTPVNVAPMSVGLIEPKRLAGLFRHEVVI